MTTPIKRDNRPPTPSGEQLPEKRDWRAPSMTTYDAVSATQNFTGFQAGDGLNNNS